MKRQIAAAFVSGLLIAAGLGLSGMTNPNKVLGFLDFLGNWDPTLAFVMMGAIGTHAILYPLITRRPSPVLAAKFSVPSKRGVDWPLVLGSALFGLGWGLAGYCPGPVVVSLTSGGQSGPLFAFGMLAGMLAYGIVFRGRHAPPAPVGAKS